MTFLEYVCERLMGPPASRSGCRHYWVCPFHNDTTPSFCTLPHKPEFKDRWKCFGCGMRGDEADLMKELVPGETWDRRKARLLEWRQDFEREGKADQAEPNCFIHRGSGTQKSSHDAAEPRKVELAYADLKGEEVALLARACDLARNAGVSLEALGYYCWHSVKWFETTTAAEEVWRQQVDRARKFIKTPSRNGNGGSHAANQPK